MISIETPTGSFHSLKASLSPDNASIASEISRPPSSAASTSSSRSSSNPPDDENDTIRINSPPIMTEEVNKDDLRILAASTHMTELSYIISDIQTRIFEIQELRHQSQVTTSGQTSTNVIDQALMKLDERLESVAEGLKTVNEVMETLDCDMHVSNDSELDGDNVKLSLLGKHASLLTDWDTVQSESDTLREELKEDKWLTVFRTVSEQADGMMTSLEKAVKKCQDFIWAVQRIDAAEDNPFAPPSPTEKVKIDYETFLSLLDSFEAKKKHYMPATTKVLAIIDKGVQDRVTKNGECLRRHAESTQRWKSLKGRIEQTDVEMQRLQALFLEPEVEPSEAGSVISRVTSKSTTTKRNGFLATPPSSEASRSRAPSAASTISASISPLRRLAKKLQNSATPESFRKRTRVPATEPIHTLKRRSSFFPFRVAVPITPDRPSHKHTQSYTPDSPTTRLEVSGTAMAAKFNPPKWNSSTKVEPDSRQTLVKRPSLANLRSTLGNPPPVPSLPRSVSRNSMASRPWSPVTTSTTANSHTSPPGHSRPPSRAQSPTTKSSRIRSRTPSGVPLSLVRRTSSGVTSNDDYESEMTSSIMQRTLSTATSVSAASITSSLFSSQSPGKVVTPPHPRPPSRSMIPIPSLQINSASRPPSAMSQYERPDSSMSFRTSAHRAQTPESGLRALVSRIPIIPTSPITPRGRTRPSLQNSLPPSSFREATISRPPSRSANNVVTKQESNGVNEPIYIPVDPHDPLEVEVAKIVNAFGHGLLVERVDPPLRLPPKEGEELKAQYAIANHLARKVVTCRLTSTVKLMAGGQREVKRKVLCRVGGGWQDLHIYILNRLAGQ